MGMVRVQVDQILPAIADDGAHLVNDPGVDRGALDERDPLAQRPEALEAGAQIIGNINVDSDDALAAERVHQGGIEKKGPTPGDSDFNDEAGARAEDNLLQREQVLGKLQDGLAKPVGLVDPVVAVGFHEQVERLVLDGPVADEFLCPPLP